MEYQSTRSKYTVSPQQAVLEGIAPDGTVTPETLARMATRYPARQSRRHFPEE